MQFGVLGGYWREGKQNYILTLEDGQVNTNPVGISKSYFFRNFVQAPLVNQKIPKGIKLA